MEIFKLKGKFGPPEISNTYCLKDFGELSVIDPSHSLAELREVVGDFSLPNSSLDFRPKLKTVVLTHCHYDHWCALPEYLQAGVQVIASQTCFQNLQNPIINGSIILSGKPITVNVPEEQRITPFFGGVTLSGALLKVIETLGHTNCSLSFLFENHLFCGDFLFVRGGVGRTDLPTGDEALLNKKINELLALLPEDTVVHSGHGPDFTIKEWKDFI